jgi:SAM-dependent methyltransferase
LQAIQDWKDFMYGGRNFIGQIIHCNNCSFRYIEIPTPGNNYYTDADHSGYSSLANARLRYFLDLRTALCQRGITLSNEASMLDLGAGDGDWLSAWPEVRHRCATEMQPALLKRMNEKGIVTASGLEGFANSHFDLISAFDFLEHIEDPNPLLQRLQDRLVDGGTLIIGVPDMGKWMARLFGTRYYLYCPMHYSYFTKKSLTMLLRKYFSKIEVFPSPPMRTSLNGLTKWIFPKLQNTVFDKIWLPVGYRASLIAIARKLP